MIKDLKSHNKSKINDDVRENESKKKIENKNALIIKENKRSAAVMMHYHLSLLPSFIPSLFGCEEWLRIEIKKVLRHEVKGEIFTAWYVV